MLELTGLGPQQLGWFVLAGLLLNLTPGPDVLFIVTQALRRGARVGMVAGLGIAAGCCVHVAAAALGLSALLGASSTAFGALKWLGAAYLLWMGARMLFARPAANAQERHETFSPPSAPSLRSVFAGGFLTNVLNPKVALFFLAFVPQFIPASVPDKALAFVLLGMLFNLNSVLVSAGYAWLAAGMAQRLHVMQRSLRWLDRVAGLMFIGFGLRLALFEPSPR